MLNKGDVSRSKLVEIIKMSVKTIKVGRQPSLNSYEEELVVASAEIECDHGLPIYVNTFGAKLKFVIKSVSSQQSTKEITYNSSYKCTCSLIKRFNLIKDGMIHKGRRPEQD